MTQPVKFFVQFSLEGERLELNTVAVTIQELLSIPAGAKVENLYVHDGAGHAWAQCRKCIDCGSHLFHDADEKHTDERGPKVQCSKCGKLHDIQ